MMKSTIKANRFFSSMHLLGDIFLKNGHEHYSAYRVYQIEQMKITAQQRFIIDSLDTIVRRSYEINT